ncbi:hypothetical protein EV182_001468 [Spiromyces aspiralis]|uniref:Uncharacterized protein n=1 Tax=Spiromyces aspiralis TaxID=68401 RepID=A0ACC1HN42_9FUNG|nr:hypothetical protein EV182_001468 [Spiromyces aspiralis]
MAIQDVLLDPRQCLVDSPDFRRKIQGLEDHVTQFEADAVQTIKACRDMLSVSEGQSVGGRSAKFNTVAKQLIKLGRNQLSQDPVIENSFDQCYGLLQSIEKSRMILCTQLDTLLVQPLKVMLGTDLSNAKKEKRELESRQSSYEATLTRFMSKKASDSNLQQAARELDEQRREYFDHFQRYTLLTDRIVTIRKLECAEMMWTLMYAQHAFFQQTFIFMKDAETTMNEMGGYLEAAKKSVAEQLEEFKSGCISRPSITTAEGEDGYVQLEQIEDLSIDYRKASEDSSSFSFGVAMNPLRATFDRASRFIALSGGNEDQRLPETTATQAAGAVTSSPRSTFDQQSVLSQRHVARSLETDRAVAPNITMKEGSSYEARGYLFLRSQSAIMANWQRRWFEINGPTLAHYSRPDKRDLQEIQLHLCMAKDNPSTERRNTFGLFAPSRNYILQAETAMDAAKWVKCLQDAIQASLYAHNEQQAVTPTIRSAIARSATSPPSPGTPISSHISANGDYYHHLRRHGGRAVDEEGPASAPLSVGVYGGQTTIQQLLRQQFPDYKTTCVDCNRSDPEWASITFGSLLCIQCSGVHRSLGVHVSKVRSLNLDKWEPELMQIMFRLGNSIVNGIYEATEHAKRDKPHPGSPGGEVEAFIKDKYIRRKYVDRSIASPHQMLLSAVRKSDLAEALRAMAAGANPNDYDEETGTTPLMEAVALGDFGMAELIIMWEGDVNLPARPMRPEDAARRDDPKFDAAVRAAGGTCLCLAARNGNAPMIWYLIRRKADWNIPNVHGKVPLDIALSEGHVQAITAIRYARHQRETGAQPGTSGSGRDDTPFTVEWAVPTYIPSCGSNPLPPAVRAVLAEREKHGIDRKVDGETEEEGDSVVMHTAKVSRAASAQPTTNYHFREGGMVTDENSARDGDVEERLSPRMTKGQPSRGDNTGDSGVGSRDEERDDMPSASTESETL